MDDAVAAIKKIQRNAADSNACKKALIINPANMLRALRGETRPILGIDPETYFPLPPIHLWEAWQIARLF